MTLSTYKKNKANEICRWLKGLGFSCKIVLLKITLIKLRWEEYRIKTDAPEIIKKEIFQEVYN